MCPKSPATLLVLTLCSASHYPLWGEIQPPPVYFPLKGTVMHNACPCHDLIIIWQVIFVLCTVYPKKYAHGFCFAVLCCGYTLTDFPISIRLTSLALWQSNDCPSASKTTLMNMDKYFMWIHYERLHNHNKAKHNKTVCIFLGIYCISDSNWYKIIWICDSFCCLVDFAIEMSRYLFFANKNGILPGIVGYGLPLQWRHNERNDPSNHQPHICLLNRLFRRRLKKISKLRVTGLCEGNSPVNSQHKGPVTRKMFPFDDVIMVRNRRLIRSADADPSPNF